MDATLDIYALGPGETQLDFSGEYRAPFGVVGAVFDAIVGRRIEQAAFHRFVEEVAERLSVDVPAEASDHAASPRASH